ncbi:MAG: leucyl aminopeptidase [Lysobacteraceae bacterium]|nr:MAG: leucyl aminopeptidase [Xanthomonadaceae bacterium]
MYRLASLLAVFAALSLAAPVAAQRTLDFAPYAVPAEGAVAVTVRQGAPLEGAFAEVDRASGGALQRAVAAAGFVGDRGVVLNLPGVGPYHQVLLVGVGNDAPSTRLLEDVGGLVGQWGLLSAVPRIELLWPDASQPAAGAHLALGASLGQYAFRTYRTPRPDAPVLGKGELVLRVADAEGSRRAWNDDWSAVAEGVRFSRDLVTEPANTIHPESFVERTRAAFAGVPNVSIEVLDVPAMQKLGMESLLAVGQGSERPPRLLVVRYRGGPRDQAPLAFVGKGITFDTGGISLKNPENMWRMKYDMTGAASVTGTVLALAKRGAKVNAIAVAALAENMPSGTAVRPGDVIRTMSGKTYEVINTDAEGRMALVDAIWFVQERDRPRVLVDVATLTGSQVTALGDEYAGLFSRDEALAADLLAAGAASGEEVWRLPLHPSYAKDLESPIADLRNVGSTGGAGASIGAFFIGAWVQEGVAWAHLDVASMAWRDAPVLPTVPLGATGYGVRLLDRYVRDHVEGAAAE